MKETVVKKGLAAAATIMLFGQVASTNSQVIYNTGGDAMLQTMITNTMNQITVNDLTDPGIVMAMKAQQAAGAAKIKAGKATLKFGSSPEATKTLAQGLKWSADEPQELTGQVRYIQRYVQMFDKLMTQNSFAPNNFSDGYAFAYALSFAAANNSDLSKTEIEKIRSEDSEAGLKNAYFQGMTDAQKQAKYEFMAIMAMQAVEQRVKYRRATTESERAKYDSAAKHYAEYLLATRKTKK